MEPSQRRELRQVQNLQGASEWSIRRERRETCSRELEAETGGIPVPEALDEGISRLWDLGAKCSELGRGQKDAMPCGRPQRP